MRRSTDFATVVRAGRRARRGSIVMHRHDELGPGPALVGLVVGRGVGGSVVRHRVSRRLRAQLALRIDRLPTGSGTVVRALPAGAVASSAELGADIDGALLRLGGAGS